MNEQALEPIKSGDHIKMGGMELIYDNTYLGFDGTVILSFVDPKNRNVNHKELRYYSPKKDAP